MAGWVICDSLQEDFRRASSTALLQLRLRRLPLLLRPRPRQSAAARLRACHRPRTVVFRARPKQSNSCRAKSLVVPSKSTAWSSFRCVRYESLLLRPPQSGTVRQRLSPSRVSTWRLIPGRASLPHIAHPNSPTTVQLRLADEAGYRRSHLS